MPRHPSATGAVILAVLTAITPLIPAPACAGAQGEAEARVGPGDYRQGYEKNSYRTRSQKLAAGPGVATDLARLAGNPPPGLPAITAPPAAALIDLGRRLFFDRRLSRNSTLSSGMCHVPEQAFTQNELATPVGIEGRFVRRNTPSLYNVVYETVLFRDGRESDLSAQIWSPLLAPNEMGNSSRGEVLSRLQDVKAYDDAFNALFPDGMTAENLGFALAAYERGLVSGNSAFDRWFYGGKSNAIDAAGKRGFWLFRQHHCADCHLISNRASLFTDHDFHNTGVGFQSQRRFARPPARLQIAPGVSVPLRVHVDQPDRTDHGRENITGKGSDRWKFKTPGLRNVALTAPYMHDGSLTSLDAVINFYNDGGGRDPLQNPLVQPLGLSASERGDLVGFLESLTGANVAALAADARSAPIGDPH